jgi:hypothetical protein
VLRSTAPALYGASHLFSTLQHALYQAPNRIRLNPVLRSILHDWEELAVTAHQPQSACIHLSLRALPLLVPRTLPNMAWAVFGSTLHTTHLHPHVCGTHHFPSISSNAFLPTPIPMDNSLIVTWNCQWSSVVPPWLLNGPQLHSTPPSQRTTLQPILFNERFHHHKKMPAFLLHLLAHLRHDTPFNLTTLFTPGSSNTLVDCCSRLFHLTDDQFLDYKNTNFPMQPSWTLVTLPTSLCCELNSALYSRLQQLASPPKGNVLDTACGTYGKMSVAQY